MAHGNVLSNRNYVEMPSADILGEDVRAKCVCWALGCFWRVGDALKRFGGSSAGVAVRWLSRGVLLAQTTGIKAVLVPSHSPTACTLASGLGSDQQRLSKRYTLHTVLASPRQNKLRLPVTKTGIPGCTNLPGANGRDVPSSPLLAEE